MKQIIYLLLLASVLLSCKKENVTSANYNKTLVSVDYTTDIKFDSVVLTEKECQHWHSFKYGDNIAAVFNKKVPHIYIIAFYANGKHYTNEFWLNNGTPLIKLHLSRNEVVIDSVYNAPIYYEYISFFNKLDEFDKSKDSIARDKYMIDKLNAHFTDCFSNLVAANYIIYHQNSPEKLRFLLNRIEKQNDSIKYGYMSEYSSLKKRLNSDTFNLFTYNLMNPKGIVKKPDRGDSKLYLLDFWFVNCPPCVADHKMISRKLDELKEKNIEVMGISRDEDYEKWAKYLNKYNYKWSNYKQIYFEKNIPTEVLGINAYPTYLIINSSGEIVSKRYNSVQEVFAHYLDK